MLEANSLPLGLQSGSSQHANMDIEYFPEPKVLLIYGHEPIVVARLREQLAELAAERIDCFAVHELSDFRSIDGCQLFAQQGGRNFGTRPDPSAPVFRCSLTPLSWYNIEGLLVPFSDGSYFAASHQFLDRHGEIQLIISGSRGW
jgi:hypothetical protein